MRIFVLVLSASVLASSACAEIYKWRDEKGTIHFSDREPATGRKAEVYVPGELNTSDARPVTYQPPQVSEAETQVQSPPNEQSLATQERDAVETGSKKEYPYVPPTSEEKDKGKPKE